MGKKQFVCHKKKLLKQLWSDASFPANKISMKTTSFMLLFKGNNMLYSSPLSHDCGHGKNPLCLISFCQTEKCTGRFVPCTEQDCPPVPSCLLDFSGFIDATWLHMHSNCKPILWTAHGGWVHQNGTKILKHGALYTTHKVTPAYTNDENYESFHPWANFSTSPFRQTTLCHHHCTLEFFISWVR